MPYLTPPMGWNSWNTYGEKINEKVVMESADALVESGLKACGYEYVVIDDCWLLHERDENGRLVPDPDKFPHGMKYVSDYVHSKGLKFGMYSCAGYHTCAGYPASFDHEMVDAASFAEWGIDLLKYDYCFHPTIIPGDVLYKRMSVALANCGRKILFSACSWGADETREWIKETGAHMWRTTGDLYDSWKSLKERCLEAPKNNKFGAINCFPDMDMLIVGINGRGQVGVGGLDLAESRLHFSLWALLGSPLMIGCDIRDMDDETKSILMNKDVLAINRDSEYNQAYDVSSHGVNNEFTNNECPVYVRLLENGDFAVGMFNLSDETTSRWMSNLRLDYIGLPQSSGKTLEMTELWTGEVFKVTNGIFTQDIPAHSCRLFRAKVVDA